MTEIEDLKAEVKALRQALRVIEIFNRKDGRVLNYSIDGVIVTVKKQRDIAAARAESATLKDGHHPCRFCQHFLGQHNRIEGCQNCKCLATPGEARPRAWEY